MTKRLYTMENVLEAVLEDMDDDCKDPYEPVMEASDDEFSDLELDEDDTDIDLSPPSNLPWSPSLSTSVPASSSHTSPAGSSHPSPSSPTSNSPPPPATWTATLNPVEVNPFTSLVGAATANPESPREVSMFFSDDLMTLMVTESNRYAEGSE